MKPFEGALTEFEALCDDPAHSDVLFSTWRTIAGIKGRYADALARVFQRRGRVTLVVGGIVGDASFAQLLIEIRTLLNRAGFRNAAKARILRIAHDFHRKKKFHAKMWIGMSRGKIAEARCSSFNLSDASLRTNFEMGTQVKLSEPENSKAFIEMTDLLSDHKHLIDWHTFFDQEAAFLSPPKKALDESLQTLNEKNFGYLDYFRKKHGPGGPRSNRKAQKKNDFASTDADLDLKEIFVVLRDPSRGEKPGFRIPDEVLMKSLGEAFVSSATVKHGFIEPPKSRIFPFGMEAMSEHRDLVASFSALVQKHCVPTSLGYVVSGSNLGYFTEAMSKIQERMHAMAEIFDRKSRSEDFADGFDEQVKDVLVALAKRYGLEGKFDSKKLAAAIEASRTDLKAAGLKAAKIIIGNMKRDRTFSTVSLADLIEMTSGVSRAEIIAELTESAGEK